MANGDAKPEPSPDHRDEAPPGNREPAWLGTQPDNPGALVSTRRANRRGTNGSDFANDAEVSLTAMLEEHGRDNDAFDDASGAVPLLDELSDRGDPCLRW